MKKILKLFESKILPLLPYLLVFFASIYRPYDADLGWHLKYGEYFFKTGQVLRDNIFSYEMPDYKWVNHSWGSDILLYFFYNYGGFLGVSILGAIIVTLTFYFFSKAASLSFWEQSIIFPILLFFENSMNVISFRSQQMTLLYLGILFYLLSFYEKEKTKKIFLVIPLFAVWVNTHGGFILGFAILGIWISFYFLRELIGEGFKNWKKVFFSAKELFLIPLAAILACLVNPFGERVFEEGIRHFNNPTSQFILEWLPFEDLSSPWWNHIVVGCLMLFGAMFLFFNDEIKPKISTVGVLGTILFLSFWARRYAWPLYYLSLPLLKPIAKFFEPENQKSSRIAATVLIFLSLGFVIWNKLPLSQFRDMSWRVYCSEYAGCSDESARFLIKNNLLGEKTLTMYNWGGWLIWNYPEIKPTIDGRMSFWKDEEGYSAFEEYYKFEQELRDIDSSKYNVVYMSPTKNSYNRLMELVEQGRWRLVYKDKFAGIFVRNTPK